VSSNTGEVTISTSTSNLPDNITRTSSIAIARSSGTTSYARVRFTLDQADYGKKFKIQWDQIYSGTAGDFKVQVWSNTASDYSGTATQLTVASTNIPSGTSTFVTSVDMPGSAAPYIELRIVASAGSTLYIAGVLVGPGQIVQGAAISEWVDFTPVLKGSTTDPSLGTTGQAQYGRYLRIGSNAKIRYNWRFGTTSPAFGSGTYFFLMPTGLTVDTARLESSTNNNVNPIVGHGYVTDDSAGINYLTEVVWDRTNDRLTFLAGSNGVAVTQLAPMTFATQDSIIIEIEVPIAEWAGSGTVNLGPGAQVEYAYNSTAWGTSNTTAFAYGPIGAAITGALSTEFQQRIRFQYPIQNDDEIFLEFRNSTSDPWMPQSAYFNALSDSISPYTAIIASGPTETQGASFYRVSGSTTDLDVVFGRYVNKSYNGTSMQTKAWATGPYWRVRKAKASAPVGFGKADSSSFGLVAPRLGQYSLTVTGSVAGYASVRAVGVYYQDQDGNHRLKFNIVGTCTLGTYTGNTFTITGITFKNVSSYFQAVTAFSHNTAGGSMQAFCTPNSNTIVLGHSSTASINGYSVSGDVELNSKPTWA
jgi:hypothetical protein